MKDKRILLTFLVLSQLHACIKLTSELKVVSATFLLVCFVCLKDGTCETRKNVFYFTSKALFGLEIITF